VSSAKRVLVITKNDFTSRRDGGSKRTAAVIDELSADGWEVTWLACKPTATTGAAAGPRLSDALTALAILARSFRFISLSTLKWFSFRSAVMLARITRANDFDAVFLEHAQLIAYLPDSAGVRVANMHNVESELLDNYGASEPSLARRFTARFEATRMRRIETELVHDVDLVSTVSTHDEAQILSRHPHATGRTIVASNGVDDAFFRVSGTRDHSAVFIGHLGWRPNVDAVRWFTTKVWPIAKGHASDLRLQVIGRSPDRGVLAVAGDSISVIADVPSVLPYLASAGCATAPLLSAGGTRIKILEALAAGTPVVATSLGALGLEHLAGPHLVITDDPAEFGAAVARLAGADADRDEVRDLVRGYGWHSTLAPLLSAVNTVRERAHA